MTGTAPATGGSSGVRREIAFLKRTVEPYRRDLGLVVLLMSIESATMLSLPWFAGRVTESLLAARVPGRLLLAWLAVMALQAMIAVVNAVLSGRTAARLVADLGSHVYDHLQSLPLSWHQERKRGEVLSLLVNDVWRISSFLSEVVLPLLPLLLTCAGALILLVRIEPGVGVIVAVGVPLFTLLARFLARELRPLAQAYLREDAVKYGIAEQNLAVLPLIKANTREPLESARFSQQVDKVRRLEERQQRIEALLAPAVRLLAAAAVLGLVWLGGERVAAGRLATPELVSLLLYGLLLAQPVGQLAGVYGRMQVARGAVRRLYDALAERPEPDPGRREPPRIEGRIAFENVRFAYPGRAPVFESLELRVDAGETVALTGPNGAGKSTVAHLLMRFADPAAGRITIDGIDLREFTMRSLRTHVGWVSQHVLLLNASVADNIAYGRYGADRAAIERAARAAHAHEFIQRLPQGYDTVIGDEGLRLSGGQRQRISLARALLKDPAVLVLDEATAMFDPQGERDFVAECHGLLRSRTVLLITHRPASLALADRVLHLEAGRVVAEDRPPGDAAGTPSRNDYSAGSTAVPTSVGASSGERSSDSS